MAIGVSVSKAMKMTREAVVIASESMRMAEKALEVSHKIVGTIGEVAKMVEVGCGTIIAMD